MSLSRRRISQPGFTLIEIVVTLVVIGIAASALMGVFSSIVRGSADPAIQQQAITIAEAYIEEITLKSFDDPDDVETGTSEGEAGRASYDDVKDYRSLAAGAPADQTGTAIATLAAYTVTVTITDATLNGIAALLIDVNVTHPAVAPILLSAYRTN